MEASDAHNLLQLAWGMRRASLEAAPKEQQALLVRARAVLQTAAGRFLAAGGGSAYARALHLQAHIALDLGELEAALALWEEAVAVLRQVDDPGQLAHKVRHLGDIYRLRGRTAAAVSCYEEALVFYRARDRVGDVDHANAARRLADLKEQQGQGAEALALWREARVRYATALVLAGMEEADAHIRRLEGCV